MNGRDLSGAWPQKPRGEAEGGNRQSALRAHGGTAGSVGAFGNRAGTSAVACGRCLTQCCR